MATSAYTSQFLTAWIGFILIVTLIIIFFLLYFLTIEGNSMIVNVIGPRGMHVSGNHLHATKRLSM